MIIYIKKFGTTLTSRDSGREAFSALKSTLKELKTDESLILDFSGVNTFTPSWGDEFISNLHNLYKDNLVLKNTENKSVKMTLELLSEINKVKFNIQ